LKEPDSVADERDASSVVNSATKELNRLSKEGFVVRDFVCCQMGNKKGKPARAKILLERAE
jgi:hypothetical protein